MAVGASFVGIVFFVAILGGLWTGLVGLRQAGKNASWWMMLLGLTGISLAIVGAAFVMTPVLGAPPSRSALNSVLVGLATLSVPFFVLLFSVGFAIHGMKTARIRERLEELEQLTEAMSSEIDHLRAGRPNA